MTLAPTRVSVPLVALLTPISLGSRKVTRSGVRLSARMSTALAIRPAAMTVLICAHISGMIAPKNSKRYILRCGGLASSTYCEPTVRFSLVCP